MMERATVRPTAWSTMAASAAGLAVTMALTASVVRIPPAGAQTAPAPAPAAKTALYQGSAQHYTVALPVGCRTEEGPGTVDAICAPDLDPARSAVASAAAALLLGVAVESLAGEGDTSVAGLLQRYTEAGFKAELPEAICGETDKARVKIENLSQTVEGARLVYTADVTCAEIKFLQIGKRQALVRHMIGPDTVFRLVARAPQADFATQRPTIDAFFASFRITAAEKSDRAEK